MSTRPAVLILILGVPIAHGADPKATATLDFARDIRPILADNCFACHGPDASQRKAKLRLDTRAGLAAVVAAGKSGDSALVKRVIAAEDERMPPAKTGKQLNASQIDRLRRWIDAGARWSDHWAFVRPQRPPVPAVRDTAWVRNEIDQFIAAKLQAASLAPSQEADRATLIRRLSLDLTGLPPSIADVDAFLADQSPDAYERLVDRLLASPHYGEKLAQDWLDLARFGDTNGYQDDATRPLWLYRDAVIASFNAGKPFDQFTIENLAGDLLPGATTEQRILSGFNRNHRYNEEGGSDPDEFLVVYAQDRTNTTATAWLGLTLTCAQCHDHKYDPISQKEYYQLYAFFNSVKGEVGVSKSPSPPILRFTTTEQQVRLDAMSKEIAALDTRLKDKLSEEEKKKVTADLAAKKKDRAALDRSIPQTLVMEEMDTPRPAFVLKRGDFRNRAEEVKRGVPGIFPPLRGDSNAPNRLDLARWLVAPEHPLTARVAVNRLWKQFFGAGLVRTMEDFGIQGEPPSHAELLDWLATQLIADGWDLKRFQRRVVLSATYRQRSSVTPRVLEIDAANRLLARGPRFRLSAEEIRDNALAVSGLLSPRIGGPSVHPYQPAGYFNDKSSDWSWNESAGSEQYRRGLYTFWRRTTLHPTLQTFDAPSRGDCVVNRPRTNTPLQALITLNDPTFVEAARVLAQRILREGGANEDARLTLAFRQVLSREPDAQELAILRRLYEGRLQRYRADAKAAGALVSVGKAPRPSGLDTAELAAWTAVANTMLNLDEAIMRE